MSANNWARCPRCVHRDQLEIEVMAAKVESDYGVVSVKVFDEERRLLAQRRDAHEAYDTFRTFREDYEFSGAEEGIVEVDYHGHCKVCGLTLKIGNSHPLDVNGSS